MQLSRLKLKLKLSMIPVRATKLHEDVFYIVESRKNGNYHKRILNDYSNRVTKSDCPIL